MGRFGRKRKWNATERDFRKYRKEVEPVIKNKTLLSKTNKALRKTSSIGPASIINEVPKKSSQFGLVWSHPRNKKKYKEKKLSTKKSPAYKSFVRKVRFTEKKDRKQELEVKKNEAFKECMLALQEHKDKISSMEENEEYQEHVSREMEKDKAGLCQDQKRAYEAIVEDGESGFITGVAGTGKTHLINAIEKGLKLQGKNVAKTATTGIAASKIGGVTFSKWSCIARIISSIKNKRKHQKTKKNYSRKKRLLNKEKDTTLRVKSKDLDTLGSYMNMALGRKVRSKNKEWWEFDDGDDSGKEQYREDPDPPYEKIVREFVRTVKSDAKLYIKFMTTDCLIIDEVSMQDGFILDVLSDGLNQIRRKDTGVFGGMQIVFTGDFLQLPAIKPRSDAPLYKSRVWSIAVKENTFLLRKIRRQRDPKFKDLLMRMRSNEFTYVDLAEVEERILRDLKTPEEAIRFFSNPQNRVKLGMKETDSVPTIVCTRYKMVEECNQNMLQELKKSGEESMIIEAKTAIQNVTGDDSSESNELRGFIEKMKKNRKTKFRKEFCVGARVMLNENLDVERGLTNGTTGTILRFQLTDINADIEGKTPNWWTLPVVRFDMNMSNSPGMYRDVLVHPKNHWDYQASYLHAKYSQVPLELCWAITGHKSQGMTLNSVVICADYVFAEGLMYCMVSRATHLNRLWFLPCGDLTMAEFENNKAHVKYYKKLQKKIDEKFPLLYSDSESEDEEFNCAQV